MLHEDGAGGQEAETKEIPTFRRKSAADQHLHPLPPPMAQRRRLDFSRADVIDDLRGAGRPRM
jgi:hypothetical protein